MNKRNILPPRGPKGGSSRRLGKPKGGERIPLELAMELAKNPPQVVEEKPQRRLICE